MNASQFADIQEALLIVLLPIVQWLLVLFLVGSIFGASLWIWLGFLRHMTRPQ